MLSGKAIILFPFFKKTRHEKITTIFNVAALYRCSQSSNPLIVVHGVPLSNAFDGAPVDGPRSNESLNRGYDFGNQLNNINPQDIAKVTVLKGASATAMYGNRAANGVILVTTKKSADTQNQIGLRYSGNVVFSRPLRLPTYQTTFGQGWDGRHLLEENGSWGPGVYPKSGSEPVLEHRQLQRHHRPF